MDTVLSQQDLEEMFDEVIRATMIQTCNMELHTSGQPPNGDLRTVHITFKRGFTSSVTMCVENAMLVRMARSALWLEEVTQEDVEDFTKEFFNILCGHFTAALYKATKVAARFSVPSLYTGRFEPEGYHKQFVLNYTNDQGECAQLVHHIPSPRIRENAEHPTQQKGN